MNFTLVNQEPESKRVKQNILIDGIIFGQLVPTDYNGPVWHAEIHALGSSGGLLGLLQGNGPTPEAAIRNCFVSARSELAKRMDVLQTFAAKIGYKD